MIVNPLPEGTSEEPGIACEGGSGVADGTDSAGEIPSPFRAHQSLRGRAGTEPVQVIRAAAGPEYPSPNPDAAVDRRIRIEGEHHLRQAGYGQIASALERRDDLTRRCDDVELPVAVNVPHGDPHSIC